MIFYIIPNYQIMYIELFFNSLIDSDDVRAFTFIVYSKMTEEVTFEISYWK